MLYGHLKILLSIATLIVPLLHAKQVRLDHDRHATLRIVQQPLDAQWILKHPQQSLQIDRMETRRLHQLIWDLDH
jgi:hypothetical protein